MDNVERRVDRDEVDLAGCPVSARLTFHDEDELMRLLDEGEESMRTGGCSDAFEMIERVTRDVLGKNHADV